MASVLPEQQAEINKPSIPIMVPTLRGRYILERGILVCEKSGLTYTPVAHSWGGVVAGVGLVLWVVINILNTLSGGFIGFVWNFAIIILIVLIVVLPFRYVLQIQAMKQEKNAKTSGLASVKPLEGWWHLNWDEVISMSFMEGTRITLEIIVKYGENRKLFLLGKESALGFSNSGEAFMAIKDGVKLYSPRELIK